MQPMTPSDRSFERAARISGSGLTLVALGIGLAPWLEGGMPAQLTMFGFVLAAVGLHRMGRSGQTR